MAQIPESLKAQFLTLYKIALVDDHFSHLEMKMLYEFARVRGVSRDNLDKVLLNTSEIDITEIYPESLEEKIEYLYNITEMIWADGVVNINERNALEKYIKSFGFLDENILNIAEYLIQSIKDRKPLYEIINELNS